MASSSKGKRLLKRYPILAPVPEEERAKVVKAALRNPLVIIIVGCLGFFLLPPYFKFALEFLKVEQDPVMLMQLAKISAAVLLPIVIAVPLLSRYVMPYFLRSTMIYQGYLKKDEDAGQAEASVEKARQPAGQEAPEMSEAPLPGAAPGAVPAAPDTPPDATPDAASADASGTGTDPQAKTKGEDKPGA